MVVSYFGGLVRESMTKEWRNYTKSTILFAAWGNPLHPVRTLCGYHLAEGGTRSLKPGWLLPCAGGGS
jgi:hypothetical protein